MRLRRTGPAFTLALLAGAARLAHADPLPTSAEHVAAPGRSIVSEDTTEAMVQNPANLSFMPGPEVRFDWVGCQGGDVKVGCGESLALATPVFLGWATGVRFESVSPTSPDDGQGGAGFPYAGYGYGWLTWTNAVHFGEHVAVGLNLEYAFSPNSYINGLTALTAGVSYRPNTHFGFAAVARDFNRPSQEIIPLQATPGIPGGQPVLDGKYAFGMAFRPTGRRALELGVEAQYYQGSDTWTERATLGFDVPGFGRAFGSAEAVHLGNDEQRGVVGTAGLELHWGGLSAGGGAIFGDGLGSPDDVAEYATVALSGFTQPGIPQPAHAAWVRIESTPSVREHTALLRKLWRAAEEKDVAAVTLILRAEPADSFAHAEELADAIRVLRAHHKKVMCSLEDAGSRSLYVCANADRTVVTPAGGVRYAGLRSQYIYLKGLLDKIGVKAEFVRIGPHKTAPEQFTNEHAGPVAAQDHMDLLAQQEATFVRNESLYRHMDEAHVREVTKTGPFVAEEAKQAGFVDGYAFDDEVEHATMEMLGRDVGWSELTDEDPAPAVFGGPGKIAILYLEGDIVDGRSQHIPIVDMRLAGSYSMQDQIKRLRDDPSVRAVVLRIESPGGSSLASDVMWRELQLLAKKKPLVVSMGGVAASGGYYVASASRDIYALPLTITGSIGVFYGKADISGLLGKIGVSVDTYKTAPRADAESLFRSFTPDEEHELEHKVDQFYDTFLDRIQTGRGMPKATVDAIGRGKVWTGQQAFERHLVDHLGGLRDALADARAQAYLPQDAPIEEYPPREASWLVDLVKLAVGGDQASGALSALPPALKSLARALAPMMVYRSDVPLARMEWVEAPLDR